MTVIRIVIVEDQQLIRRAFASLLSLEPDIEVVGQAADGIEAVEMCRRFRPDVILMDIQMPRLGGIAATTRILAEFPGTQVVILTTFDTDDLVFGAISAGAAAYLLKDASEAEILDTIRGVMRGESRISPNVARKLFDELRRSRPADPQRGDAPCDLAALTEREQAILDLIAQGQSNRQIAATLFLAEGTVKNYVSRIMEKLGVQSRTELAVKAVRSARR
ncbi:LuxR family transcriptional regulator [Azospirillum sp. TSH100]|uniref:response regulator n=1 Tax=Azospirillum sp. TSH100 TaxID=652764 RepID=UPI000D619FD4|nr:response regulator transcription factor [Azospirillum sp. TSH100]PWC81736.1 LuxR family transcriptional regulator [Azospirillum sp. TSH100]QCG89006.1 response regulator transcription factor [Azospirillum sp. TSH100]